MLEVGTPTTSGWGGRKAPSEILGETLGALNDRGRKDLQTRARGDVYFSARKVHDYNMGSEKWGKEVRRAPRNMSRGPPEAADSFRGTWKGPRPREVGERWQGEIQRVSLTGVASVLATLLSGEAPVKGRKKKE